MHDFIVDSDAALYFIKELYAGSHRVKMYF